MCDFFTVVIFIWYELKCIVLFSYTLNWITNISVLTIRRMNLVLFLSESENTKRQKITGNLIKPSKSDIKPMKNYLCSVEHQQWFQDTCWTNPCWVGGLYGKEKLIAVTKANTKFHYGGEPNYPVPRQSSCSQTVWKVTVFMSKALKIFWHTIAQ